MIKFLLFGGVTVYIAAVVAKARGDIRKALVRDTPLFAVLIFGAVLFNDVITAIMGIHRIYFEAILWLALIFVGVGLTIIHTVIPFVINKLGHVKKHPDNIASESDDAKMLYDAGSRKPLCQTPSDEYSIDELTESEENTVVVRHNIFWVIPPGLLFSPQIAIMASNSDTEADAIILSIFGILVLYWSFSSKIIFDEFGITVDDPDKITSLPWDAIAEVDSFSIAAQIDARFVFKSKDNNFVIISEVWHRNCEQSLKYAVEKLPPEVFNASARQRLSEMGICHLDW